MIPVKEVMTRNVITFREDTPVEEIAQTLSSRRITGAPVVAGDGLVVGIVSEVDVFSKKGAVAKDIMSPHVISVTEDTGIDEAARLLAGERIRRVPVIKGGKMVGLLSRSDVLDFFAKTRWTCNVCGRWERGLERPERCFSCSSTDIHLERADPGH
ncbi:MAG: CBS domain-containing protein [Chloroflexi bacterium]|nr:MAG: CBS domain-containing protein [Chloroflexota bacterium]TME08095.1 MAG: CBS domain-containing protein [Chloroflexota bacterium]TME92341.1 MAG: CBS domain-containing protein [Chloroflexota bacterium]